MTAQIEKTGGCQCGAVRYTVNANNLVAYACHCTECQKQSASGFGISIPVLETAFTISGELKSWSRTTDSGSQTDCYFCPTCGTRVYHDGASRPGLITIKGGLLDQAKELKPVAHIWVKNQQDWLKLDGDVPQWQTQPKDHTEWMELLGWTR